MNKQMDRRRCRRPSRSGLLTLPSFLTGGDDAATRSRRSGIPAAASCKAEGAGESRAHDEGHERRRLQARGPERESGARELLGLVVRAVPGRDPRVHQGARGSTTTRASRSSASRPTIRPSSCATSPRSTRRTTRWCRSPVKPRRRTVLSSACPHPIIVARDGSVCKRHFGPLSKEQLEKEIKGRSCSTNPRQDVEGIYTRAPRLRLHDRLPRRRRGQPRDGGSRAEGPGLPAPAPRARPAALRSSRSPAHADALAPAARRRLRRSPRLALVRSQRPTPLQRPRPMASASPPLLRSSALVST